MTNLRTAMLWLAALTLVVRAGEARAFHAGGVAECGGCHSMHTPAAGGSYLLVGRDPSSACLTCHEHAGDTGPSSYHVSTAAADMPAGTAPLQRTPGGDFGWLKKTYITVVRNNTLTEAGESHGHNIIALDKGYVADSRPSNATAPGGTYPNASFYCNSCHDPHGKFRRAQGDRVSTTGLPIATSGSYTAAGNEPTATAAVGAYRILAGNGYTSFSAGTPGFRGVPAAKVSSSYNRSEAATDTRVAYGHLATNGNATWGTWCGTCHPDMHSSGSYVHPVDQSLGATITGNYNRYVMSGNMNGVQASSFSSLAPFAIDAGAPYAQLATAAGTTAGPATSDRVVCLSCHRAHASGFVEMLRWNMETTFVVSNGAYPLDAGPSPKTQAEYQAAYYDRAPTKFATYQRVLCNKCHAKD